MYATREQSNWNQNAATNSVMVEEPIIIVQEPKQVWKLRTKQLEPECSELSILGCYNVMVDISIHIL